MGNETSKHTPGPWTTDTGGDVTRTDGTTLLTREKPMDCGLDESFANAALAAAAPDLLEALTECLDAMGDSFGKRTHVPINCPAAAKGFAAVHKARTGAQS
jgi:hypothetical protein